MPVVNTRKPAVVLTAYDANGTELTIEFEIGADTDAAAIEIWQKTRKYMELLAEIYKRRGGKLL